MSDVRKRNIFGDLVEPTARLLYTCRKCGKTLTWYCFKQPIPSPQLATCISCDRIKKEPAITTQIKKLIVRTMSNNLPALRDHLFDCLERVKSKEMTIAEAKTVCEIAQVIINTAKVEVEFIKTVGGIKKSEFFKLENPSYAGR